MIVDLLQPVLHAADPSASSIAACAFTACLQVQPLPPPLPHIPPHSPPPPACYPCPPTACARPALLLIMLASFAPAGGALHSVQHEVIVAEVVAAWSRLPTAARVLLLPVFVQVHAISARVTSAIAHHPPGARWMRTLLCGVGYGHVQGHLAQRRPHPQPPLPLLRHSPPSLTFQSRRVVGVRTPFLTALLDALSSALSRACMSRSCDTALLSSVASSPGQEARRRARRRRSYNWLRLRASPHAAVQLDRRRQSGAVVHVAVRAGVQRRRVRRWPARMRHPAVRLPWVRAHLARLHPAFPSPRSLRLRSACRGAVPPA
jgi:hypothetical protein